MDHAYRISFFGDDIEELSTFDVSTGKTMEKMTHMVLFPANLYVAPRERFTQSIWAIQEELEMRKKQFIDDGRFLEAKRLEERVNYDLGNDPGAWDTVQVSKIIPVILMEESPARRPFCLLDYFPDDYLMVIDESHVTVGQITCDVWRRPLP